MKISTKGRYALRFMIDLVQNGGDSYTSLKDVTRRQTISPKYLEQIATSLSKSGLILSVRWTARRLQTGKISGKIHRGRHTPSY